MSEKVAYLYAHQGYADWEPPYLTSELNSGEYFAEQGSRIPVRTVGIGTDDVTTWAGLRVGVDHSVEEIAPSDAAVLILPGGDTWLEPQHEAVLAKAREFLDAGVPVAAICGATMALANAGMLDDIPHTSNNLGALQAQCPGYGGAERYVEAPAVAGGDVITATGLAPLEFARETLARLGVIKPEVLDAWYRLNTERSAEAYFALARLMGYEVG